MAAVVPLDANVFMSVKQVAEYLHLNEKKIYALVNEGKIPATKITGKWMFPRELVDRWILDSTQGGILTDRLILSGSDDPLLYRVIMAYGQEIGARALVSYMPVGTRQGLDLLAANRIDVCSMHWGPDAESAIRHPALLSQYPQHKQWVMIRAFQREQGLMVRPALFSASREAREFFTPAYRWVMRQSGAGAQRFLLEMLSRYGVTAAQLNTSATAYSEREAAATLAMNMADVAPGARAAAHEYGLGFVPCGWESFDLVMHRSIWFRRLFQDLLSRLKSKPTQLLAEQLGGYDLAGAGELVWGED